MTEFDFSGNAKAVGMHRCEDYEFMHVFQKRKDTGIVEYIKFYKLFDEEAKYYQILIKETFMSSCWLMDDVNDYFQGIYAITDTPIEIPMIFVCEGGEIDGTYVYRNYSKKRD